MWKWFGDLFFYLKLDSLSEWCYSKARAKGEKLEWK